MKYYTLWNTRVPNYLVTTKKSALKNFDEIIVEVEADSVEEVAQRYMREKNWFYLHVFYVADEETFGLIQYVNTDLRDKIIQELFATKSYVDTREIMTAITPYAVHYRNFTLIIANAFSHLRSIKLRSKYNLPHFSNDKRETTIYFSPEFDCLMG